MRSILSTEPTLGGILVVESNHAGFYSEIPMLSVKYFEAMECRVKHLYHIEEMSTDYFL